MQHKAAGRKARLDIRFSVFNICVANFLRFFKRQVTHRVKSLMTIIFEKAAKK